MDVKQLQALANELAKNLKTPEDLNQFDRLLKKVSVEAALNAGMTHYLRYDKNQPRTSSNARNGYSTKTVASSVAHWNCKFHAIHPGNRRRVQGTVRCGCLSGAGLEGDGCGDGAGRGVAESPSGHHLPYCLSGLYCT